MVVLLRCRRKALTLTEMLVVLGIIAVGMTLLTSAVMRARSAAASLQCANNLKHIVLASHAFHDAHNQMPPTFGFFPDVGIYNGEALGPLFFHLLPYLSEKPLFESARYKPPSSPQEDYYFYKAADVHRQVVSVFLCPSDSTAPTGGVNPVTGYAVGNYAANHLVFGLVGDDGEHLGADGRARLHASFPDGTSQTIAFGEKYASSRISAADNANGVEYVGGSHWDYFQADCYAALFAYYYKGETDPNSVGPTSADDPRDSRFQVQPSRERCNPCKLATPHGAMNTAFADGSVRTLTDAISARAWWALVTPAGNDK